MFESTLYVEQFGAVPQGENPSALWDLVTGKSELGFSSCRTSVDCRFVRALKFLPRLAPATKINEEKLCLAILKSAAFSQVQS